MLSLRRLRAGAVLALALLAAGCGAIFDPPDTRPCPAVVAIADASRLTRFQGPGRDLTDVVFDAALEEVKFECDYKSDGVVVNLDVVMTAAQGPANTTRSAPFRYFVAIATEDRRVLTRQEFPIEVPFQGNVTRVRVTDMVEPRIPLREGESGASYRIFVGLVLTEEELAYNRSRR